jgi:hypothetical protein
LEHVILKFNIFNRFLIGIEKTSNQWSVFYLGNEGKKRLANDVVIPSDITDKQLVGYLSDLFHEFATVENSQVKQL